MVSCHSRDSIAEMAWGLSSFGISLFLLGHLCQSFSQSAPDIPYTAGVVEFSPNISHESANVEQNLRAYDVLARDASSKGVQILIFPEDGIIGYRFSNRSTIHPYLEILPPTPAADVSIIPCNNLMYNNQFILQSLSCIARRHQVVLVANMGEKVPCSSSDPHCPSDGRYQYETTVVLESDGRFVTKYRKFNLINLEKEELDVPLFPEHVTFTTSFGVTFGIIICSNLLFKEPALTMVERGVKNFIFNTAWGNQLPSFMSISIQQAWSRTTGTTFLAANYHWPKHTGCPSTGSGIYSSGTPIATFVSGVEFAPATGHLVVAKVPPDGPHEEVIVKPEGVGTKRPEYMAVTILSGKSPVYSSHTLPEARTTLTCSLKYTLKKRYLDETYGLGALVLRKENEHHAICTLFKCTDPSCKDTSFQPTTEAFTTFSSISLSGDFPEGSVLFPGAIGNHYHLLPPQYLQLEGNTLTVKHPKPSPLISVNLWSILPSVPWREPAE